MFENLTPLEKKLVIVVGSLAPIMILFFGFTWFMDSYDANVSDIESLTSEIEVEDDKTKRGILAAQRQRYYRKISFPTSEGRTASLYDKWLVDVARQEVGMTCNDPVHKRGSSLNYRNKLVATRSVFTLKPTGTLSQLIKFLHIFYSADQLHRINGLTIKPESKSKPGQEPVYSGELTMDIKIETLSLVDGPRNIDSFPSWNIELAELEGYDTKILRRNIFGPANNVPVLKKPRRLEFDIAETEEKAKGKYKTIQISATDADKGDLLEFELLEPSGSENEFGLVLGDQPRTASQRRISLRVPMQSEAVNIPVLMAVSDSGLPAKRNEIKFNIEFIEPEKDEPKAEAKAVKSATLSVVKGFALAADGQWQAQVSGVTLGDLMLRSGESIKLDDEEWKVVEVERKCVTFEVGGKRKRFAQHCTLSEPLPEP